MKKPSSVMPEPSNKLLLQTLLERKVISPAQADLAKTDQEKTGMSLEEVLIARGWVSHDSLLEAAPWLENLGTPNKIFTHVSDNYQDNLKNYHRLMEYILGMPLYS